MKKIKKKFLKELYLPNVLLCSQQPKEVVLVIPILQKALESKQQA